MHAVTKPLKKTLCTAIAATLLLLCFAAGAPVSRAADEFVGRVTLSGGVSVHMEARADSEIVASVAYGKMLVVTSAVTVDGARWYAVRQLPGNSAFSGYVPSSAVTSVASLTPEQAAFEEYLDAQGFPDSYRASLRALHALYPKWVFEAVHTNLAWSSVVANESRVGRNLVPRSSPKAYINTADVNSNGVQIGRDGYSWVAASTGIIQYYLDPRNFLNENYIFMFESLSYSPAAHTKNGVETVLRNSFMSNRSFSANGTTYYYSDAFMAAASASGVSPYHLASRVIQEQGYSGTQLSYGTVPNYNGYYNFFNINATPTGGRSSVVNGAIYAKNCGWSNPYISIVEGSAFIGNSYIKIGQDTIYFQKFDVVNASDGYYWHQYMTNVMAPASEAPKLKSAYQGNLNTEIVFRIPVYNGMPAAAVARPTGSANPSVNISAYRVSDGVLSRVSPGTTVSALLGRVGVSNGTRMAIDKSGTVMNGGETVATGDAVLIYNSSGAIFRSYTVVIFGDVDSDGALTVLDLLEIQKHLLGSVTLRNSAFTAADVNRDGSVTAADLLVLYKHLLKIKNVSQ